MTPITWKKLSETAAAPYMDAERQPFTICMVRIADKETFEAWDKRGEWPQPIQTGLKTRREAMAIVEARIRDAL